AACPSKETTSSAAIEQISSALLWYLPGSPYPKLLLAFLEILLPCVGERRNTQVYDEETYHVLYCHPPCGDMKLLRRESLTYPVVVLMKLDVVTTPAS